VTEHFRAEQVGSLLRPVELLNARAAHASSEISLDQLRAIEDSAILDAFEKQKQTGIGIFTDGEMRRASWLTDMADAVEGFVPNPIEFQWQGPDSGTMKTTASAVGAKLRKARKLTGHELPLLKKSAPGPFKITVPAPSNFVVSSYKPGLTERVYPTHADLLRDLVDITRDEIAWLRSEGVNYIQFDAPFYSHYIDPAQRAHMSAAGLDPDREFDKAIAGDNASFAGIDRAGVTLALHVCRGNRRSTWFAEGGYDAIAEKLFNLLDVDIFMLEYDDQRSGGFEPLRLVPRGKSVVLGLVTTKNPELESQDTLRRRIDEAAKFVPLDRLALSTQCGFASTAPGNLLTMDQQWRKLELVADTARKVWG
jgi:5-methyltetrahydropteroyltriglutamate--homocysteine methyltransferase